jgi:hypothetical protein
MRTVCIPPMVQRGLLLGVFGTAAVVIARELPDIRRYIKMETM